MLIQGCGYVQIRFSLFSWWFPMYARAQVHTQSTLDANTILTCIQYMHIPFRSCIYIICISRSFLLRAALSTGKCTHTHINTRTHTHTVLANTVLSGSTFAEADLTDTDFSDAYMGDFDQRNICKNPTLKGKNPVTGYVLFCVGLCVPLCFYVCASVVLVAS